MAVPIPPAGSQMLNRGSLGRGCQLSHSDTDFQHTGPAPHKDMELLPSSAGPSRHGCAFTREDLLKMLKKCSFCLLPEEVEQGALPMLKEPDRPYSPQTDRQTARCALRRLGPELLTSPEQLRFPNSLFLIPNRADEAG